MGSRSGLGNISSFTASDLDLRRNKMELFSKLIDNQQQPQQPQQQQQLLLALGTSANKTTSEENLAVKSINNKTNRIKLERNSTISRSNQEQNIDCSSSRIDILDTNASTLPPATDVFCRIRNRWYTNDEVASILTSFHSHPEWQTNELQMRPKSGAVLLYSREKVRYRQDGYCWKKRKNGRTTREDHMKLKVQGVECIYGCYVHSAILPTFHRRCYWLLENPDIVLVHYLNQPVDDKNKMILTFSPTALEADTRRRWTNEEIIDEIGAMFGGISQIHHTLSINFNSPSNDQLVAPICSYQDEMYNNLAAGDCVDMSPAPVQTNQEIDDDDDACTSVVANKCALDQDQFMAISQDSSIGSLSGSTIKNESMQMRETTTTTTTGDDECDEMRQMDQSPCSPVTQIYNKIVDDIETYVLPLELNNQFVHRLHHVDISSSSMDTSEPLTAESTNVVVGSGGGDDGDGNNDEQIGQKCQFANDSDLNHELNSDCSADFPVCDLFSSCGLANELSASHETGQLSVASTRDDDERRANDILLTEFNLANGEDNCCANNSIVACEPNGCNDNDDVIEDMRDLMMGISTSPSANTSNCVGASDDNRSQVSGGLLVNEPLDALDLFGFRALDAHHHHHNQRHQLDVKSTTSDTDTMNRLSPMIPNVPRCNSTDNAMQSSSSLQQYQMSDHFLNNTMACQGSGPMMNGFADYNYQHISGPHRSASTNPSNSTSCSASPSSTSLLATPATTTTTTTTTSSSSTASNLMSSCADTNLIVNRQQACGSRSAYLDIGSSNSFIKLPLQQRQNSEQKEPSNSVLNSLLPKALSLDGSELSSHTHQRHHGRHLMNASNQLHQHHHHQYPHHNNHRTSPLVGATNLHANQQQHTHLRQQHNFYNNNTQGHHLMSIQSSSGQQQAPVLGPVREQQFYHQRPASARYADSSTCQLFFNNPQQQQQQQQHTISNELQQRLSKPIATRTEVLPILDYVPNWAPVSGGTKVLLVGNWRALMENDCNSLQNSLCVLFDDLLVPATLIQDNVLRFYSPQHEAGFIALRVLFKNTIVSEQVLFEICATTPPLQPPAVAETVTAAAATPITATATATTTTSQEAAVVATTVDVAKTKQLDATNDYVEQVKKQTTNN